MERIRYIPPEELDLPMAREDSEQPAEVYIENEMKKLDDQLNSLIARRELADVLYKVATNSGSTERVQKNKLVREKLEQEINNIRLRMGKLRPSNQIPLFPEQD